MRALLCSRAWLLLTAIVGCAPATESARAPKYTMVIGVDVSGSFLSAGRYDDAVRFAALYIYAHLNGFGDLRVPTALFVGSVGGTRPGEAKTFHPIHDFQGKNPEQLDSVLRLWFPPEDRLTDFNTFFAQVSDLVKQRGLILSPLNVVLFSDGVPDLTPGQQATERYNAVDVSPLEYLSRSVTVRLLYPDPTVAADWRRSVPRRRVRLWTQDAEVMDGWTAQFQANLAFEEQDELWTWISDNVDFRVRRERIF
ncbi:MAG: hypothetical protein V3R24_11005 [Gemmatimonadales bacterium]